MRRLVVWGAGELGGRVAALWAGDVLAATRTTARHDALRAVGAEPLAGSPRDLLSPTDVLLLALPGTAAQRAAVDELRLTLPPARAVLISSTGFHAGAAGAVDETSDPGPGERSQSIAACERAFLQWAGAGGVVLRCGGLWRVGRGPASALRRKGVAPVGPPDRTLALAHYDDAARAAAAAAAHAAPSPIYICVTPPCPDRRAFYTHGCRVLGLPAPDFAPATGNEPVTYDVTRLRRDLLPEPGHPDWRLAFGD